MNKQRAINQKSASSSEISARDKIQDLFKTAPLPKDELLGHLGLFIRRQRLSHILFINELYQQIVDVHGVVMEFGVRWGQDLALFSSYRGIYEPYNLNRKIIGFDTFAGFPEGFDTKDGKSDVLTKGAFGVVDGYEEYLDKLLDYHEKESPISHIKKYELVKGDACVQIDKYLKANPETIVALAYFDFDIYKPTKKCLEAILPHLTKGSVIGFDELNLHDYPGETLALKEVLGLDKYKIRRSKFGSVQSYIIIE